MGERKQEQDDFSESSPAKGKGKSKAKLRVKGGKTIGGIRVLHDPNIPNVEYEASLSYTCFFGKRFRPLSLYFYCIRLALCPRQVYTHLLSANAHRNGTDLNVEIDNEAAKC